MKRPALVLAAFALGLATFFLSSCKKDLSVKAYDNTAEREAFYKSYNAKVAAKLAADIKETEAALAGQPSDAERKEKTEQLASLKHRSERPDYFEFLKPEDLPQDLQWSSGEDQPDIGSPKAKKGGTLHYYLEGYAFPATVRPVGAEANNSFRSYHTDDIELYAVMLHPETGKMIPGLADRWAVAADGQTVYYHIDSEARWSDGKKVTSRDWVMSYYIYLSDYLSEPFYRNYYGEEYWGVATYGDDYVCLRMSTPKPLAPYVACSWIFQEDFFKEFGPDFETRYNWRPRPTTGAYVIRPEDIRKGRSISLTRVKDWWARDRKYYRNRFNPDRLEYLLVRDTEKAFQMFKMGDLDLLFPIDPIKWYEQTEVPQVFNGYIEKATYYNQFPAISLGFYLNHHQPLLGNQDIRIGLQHASNWQKVIDFDMRGDAERLNTLEAGYANYSHQTLRTRPFDVNLARAAFAKAGFTQAGQDGILQDSQGRRLSFTISYLKQPQYDSWMLRIKEEAKKAGVEFKLEGMDNSTFFAKVQRKEHEIALLGWQGQLPFPDFYQGFHSKEAYEAGTDKPKPMTNNISVFADPKVDPILEANRAARSEEVVRDTTHQLEEIFHERAVWVPALRRPFYRCAFWRWVRWPDDFNVRLGNDPQMNHVLWIDQDIKKETLDAMHAVPPRTFPEKNTVYDQHREKKTAE
ncbi:ABC transporter substrate-binding protein [Haloferula sp. BvORR071]|uniref:ABC transporter substrate-binding protein n=1 Tax=Haloferula sp. BvORR071 TaxID=1396141 RepID=UPI0006981EC2|nr:ABC transporter substrate-binding protein [Haloferula sp. BvORR071]